MLLELSKLYCVLKLELCHQYIFTNVKSSLYIHNKSANKLDGYRPSAIPATLYIHMCVYIH